MFQKTGGGDVMESNRERWGYVKKIEVSGSVPTQNSGREGGGDLIPKYFSSNFTLNLKFYIPNLY